MINPSNNDDNKLNRQENEYQDEEMEFNDKDIKTPEDLSKKCALSFLEELFYVCLF